MKTSHPNISPHQHRLYIDIPLLFLVLLLMSVSLLIYRYYF